MVQLLEQPRLLKRIDVERMADIEAMELVDGILVEKPAMSLEAYWIATRISREIGNQVPESHAYVINEAMIYPFGQDDRNGRRPDCCVLLASKFPNGLPNTNPVVVPDLVVEVLSPSDLVRLVEDRIDRYLRAGVPLLWVVNPELRSVRVLYPDGTARTVAGDTEITGEAVMPMFKCPVSRFFPPRTAAATLSTPTASS